MILGIDIGGTHITAALVHDESMAPVSGTAVRRHVPASGTAAGVLDAWTEAIREAWAAAGGTATRIGIAMPGPFDYEQGISRMKDNAKFEALYGLPLKELLSRQLHIPAAWVRFRNDAEAFLLGELQAGAGRGCTAAIGITLGTGLGSAVYRNGETRDADRWQQPLHGGIAEDFISTRFFTRRYEALTGHTVPDVRTLAGLYGRDEAAQQVFREFSGHLALFLRGFLQDAQPQAVIIGGNIARAWALFYPQLEELLRDELQTVQIRKALLGEDAALVGGACCWLDEPRGAAAAGQGRCVAPI